MCADHGWSFEIRNWNCWSTTCNTERYADTGACDWYANSLLEISKFQSICSLQDEIAKKFCRFQIREEGTKLNSAMQNAVGYARVLLLDTTPGDNEDVPKLTIKQVFAVCREEFCSINLMVHHSATWSMRACARNTLCWLKRRSNAMVSQIYPTVQICRLLSLRRN